MSEQAFDLNQPPPASERRDVFEYHEVSPEGCMATIPKGGDAKKMLEDPKTKHILVCDTGQPMVPPEEMRSPQNQDDLDNVYRWTIKNGIIDHHGVDAVIMNLNNELERKCATKMIADFPEEVLAVIDSRGITQVTAHFDGDLDSLASTYLAKSLIEHKRLPAMTEELGKQVNLVDYGKFNIKDPDKYIKSLAGIFGGIKSSVLKKQSAELGTVFGLPEKTDEEKTEKSKKIGAVFAKHGQMLIDASIQFLNSCNKLYCDKKGDIDFTDIDIDSLNISDKLKELIRQGQENEKLEYQTFYEAHEKAERSSVIVKTKNGKEIRVPVVIFNQPDLNPLSVTNKSYLVEDDNAIIAVYAGPHRKYGGDAYDIGIKPDTAQRFDLKFLEGPLNKAEARLRQPIIEELEKLQALGTITGEEKKKLDKWKTLRQGFEHLEQGDPTVCVAGGSLIAASTTSLLTPEKFRAVLAEVGI
jgi:hypothetical protein